MHIREIELVNFKSFGRKVKIPFYDDFTTISGPNGSGKSNIIDSVLFCLGLSSSRTMRAEKLTDLIFRGADKSAVLAEVTIRFDNKDREMPLEADEFSVTRRIKSSDSGYYSYYYFNEKPCSLTELHDHLAKARISPQAYNVIMQGDVTRIIEMSDVERRKVIDEIAGTAEFDEKTDKALSELEVVRERIERVSIIIAEVETRLGQLKAERDQALLYQSYKEDKVRNEGFLLLSELKEAKQVLDSLLEDIRDKGQKRESLIKDVEAKNAKVVQLKEEIKALNLVITEKGEGEQIGIRREIEEARGGIKACQSIIEFSRSEAAGKDAEKQKLFLDIQKADESVISLNGKLDEEDKRKLSLTQELTFQRSGLSEVQKKISAIDARFEGVRSRLSEKKGALEAARNLRNDKLREKDRALDSARRKQDEEQDAEAEITSSRSRMEEARVESINLEKDVGELDRRSKALMTDITDLEGARTRAKQEQAGVEMRLRKAQEEYTRAEARVRAYEEMDGYSPAVEDILKARNSRELPGIYGTIVELGKVDERYSTALEVSAGNRLQNIVVDTDEDASRCIYFLKDRRKGTATFLPLNKMRLKPMLRDMRGERGVIGYAIDLVEYEKRYESAFYYVFGDTLVVDTMETARRLIGSARMVTLEGDLVEKSGAMTGGFRSRSRLKFKASEEEAVKKLSESLAILEGERDAAIRKVEAIEGHIFALKKDRNELESLSSKAGARKEEISGRLTRLESVVREKEAAIAALRDERVALRDAMICLEEAIAKADADIVSLSGEVSGLEAELKGSEVPKLSEEASRIEEEIRRLEGRERDTAAEMSRLNMEIGFIRSRSDENRKRIEEADIYIATLKEKIGMNEAQISSLNLKMEELGRREKEIEAELKGLKRQRDEVTEALSKADNEHYDARRSLERLTGILNTLEVTRDDKLEQIKRMEEAVKERGVEPSEDVPPVEKVRANISLLERKMQELEPVNMLAITEYDSVQSRLIELTGKRDTLNKERQDILGKIEIYKAKKKEAFLSTFNAINENFKSIFAELSDGYGELILENSEDPFAGGLTILARPHGKPAQRLGGMSGGEKSLTALAFIFSIQRHMPAPFYAFDEIDMFLDGANAEKVARMIKSLSQNAQFMVVSLRKPMIESANRTIGIAMQEGNISSITGVRLYN